MSKGLLTATVKNTKDAGAGEFEAVISTEALDRDGEVLDKGWADPLPAEIPIHMDHQFFDLTKIVGRGEPFYDGDQLKVKGRYASTPDAQLVRQLVAEGMVKTMSVGYLNSNYEEKDGVQHLVSGDLIEASFVSVPANPEALVTMAKAAVKVGARNNGDDAGRLQQIHDLSVANGADCETKAADLTEAVTKAVTVKTLVGSIEEQQETLREALKADLHPDARWLWLRGTFAERVVYEVETETADGGYDTTTFEVDYEVGEDAVYTFGTPAEVDIEEIVTPSEGEPNPTPETDSAADAAKAASVPESTSPAVAMAQANATAAHARLQLLAS